MTLQPVKCSSCQRRLFTDSWRCTYCGFILNDKLKTGSISFVNRQSELALLQRALEDSLVQGGSTVAIKGAAGIGKSALIKEFYSRCQKQHPRLFLFQAELQERAINTPGSLFLETFKNLLGLEPFQDFSIGSGRLELFLQQLDNKLVSHYQTLLDFLYLEKELLQIDQIQNQPDRKEKLLKVLVEVFNFICSQGMTLWVCDNLQWIDSNSLDWLDSLLDRFKKKALLVIFSTRSEIPKNLKKHISKEINLNPLAKEDSLELARNILPQIPENSTIAAKIAEKLNNPLLIIETAKIYQDCGNSVLNSLLESNSSAKDTQQATFAARMQNLSPNALETLMCAATIGFIIPESYLTKKPFEQKVDALKELQSNQLLHLYNEGLWSFSSPCWLEFVCQNMPPKKSQKLNSDLLEFFSSSEHQMPAEFAESMIRFGRLAENHAIALKFIQVAALRAFSFQDHKTANKLLSEGLDWVEISSEVIKSELWESVSLPDGCGEIILELLLARGRINQLAGLFLEAMQDFTFNLHLANKYGTARQLSLIHRCIGLILWHKGEFLKALNHFQESLKLARDLKDSEGMAACLANIGTIYRKLGLYSRSQQYNLEALEHATQINQDRIQAGIHNNIALVNLDQAEFEPAMEHLKQALAIRRRIKDRHGEAINLNNIGALYEDMGDFNLALEYYLKALALMQNLGYLPGEAGDLDNIGNIYRIIGKFEEASQFHQKALVLRQKLGHTPGEALTRRHLGLAECFLGNLEIAQDHLTKAFIISQQIEERESKILTLLGLSIYHDICGDGQEAWQMAEEALRLSLQANNVVLECKSLVQLGEAGQNSLHSSVNLDEAILGDALRCYQKALTIAEKTKNKALEARIHANMGALDIYLGDLNEGLKLLEKSFMTVTRTGEKPLEIYILISLGKAHLKLNNFFRASEFLKNALQQANRLGYRPLLWQIIHWQTKIGEKSNAAGEIDPQFDTFKYLSQAFEILASLLKNASTTTQEIYRKRKDVLELVQDLKELADKFDRSKETVQKLQAAGFTN